MDGSLAQKCRRETKQMIEDITRLPIDLQENILRCVAFNIHNELRKEVDWYRSFRVNTPVPEGRMEELLKAAAKAIGVPLILSNRRRENVLGRMFVYAQLFREGYARDNIALAADKPVATVKYLLLQFDNILKFRSANMRELGMWTKFQELISEN